MDMNKNLKRLKKNSKGEIRTQGPHRTFAERESKIPCFRGEGNYEVITPVSGAKCAIRTKNLIQKRKWTQNGHE